MVIVTRGSDVYVYGAFQNAIGMRMGNGTVFMRVMEIQPDSSFTTLDFSSGRFVVNPVKANAPAVGQGDVGPMSMWFYCLPREWFKEDRTYVTVLWMDGAIPESIIGAFQYGKASGVVPVKFEYDVLKNELDIYDVSGVTKVRTLVPRTGQAVTRG